MTNGTFADTPRRTAFPRDDGFDALWDVWVARGRAHERLVRRKLVALAGALALGAVIVYASWW